MLPALLPAIISAAPTLAKMITGGGTLADTAIKVAAETLGVDANASAIEKKFNNLTPKRQGEVILAMEQTAQARIKAEAQQYSDYTDLLKADLHSNSWMARNWRPILALGTAIELLLLGALAFITVLTPYATIADLTSALDALMPILLVQVPLMGYIGHLRTTEKKGGKGITDAIANIIKK